MPPHLVIASGHTMYVTHLLCALPSGCAGCTVSRAAVGCALKACAGGREAHKEVKVLPRAVLAGNMPAVRADAGAPKRRRKGAAGGADAALCGPCLTLRNQSLCFGIVTGSMPQKPSGSARRVAALLALLFYITGCMEPREVWKQVCLSLHTLSSS